MSSQRRAAALFNGRHDLLLTQAQVTCLDLAIGRPMGAEDIRDLQHGGRRRQALLGIQHLERADDFAQDIGGHLRVQCSGLELLMPEQHLDDTDIDLLLQ